MAGRVDGGVKMDLAKEAVKDFASQLPEGTNINLLVYGHKGSNSESDKKISCASKEVVYPMGKYDSSTFQDALNKFQPTGWTPLAASIELAKDHLEKAAGDGQSKNLVYIVSDGIETCDGDPVKEAKELNQSDVSAVVNIIGFDVDNAGQQALKKAAQAGGGSYKTVDSANDLKYQLRKERLKLQEEWQQWLLDSHDDNQEQLHDKHDKVMDNFFTMDDLYDQEQDRVEDLESYLEGKIDAQSELDKLTDERFKKLKDYNVKRKDSIKETLSDSFHENKDHINEERDKNVPSKEAN